MKIKKVSAQELLDSRGNPTVEASVLLENGIMTSAMVPSGASTGVHEAHELRDGDKNRFMGKGVLKAVENVNTKISDILEGMDVTDQREIDIKMIELDGTEHKENIGANAILAVSMACVKAAAKAKDMPRYQYIAEMSGNNTSEYRLPIPMMNVLNGGKHAIGSSDFQEFMIMPIGAPDIYEAVRWGSEIFHHLGKIIKSKGGVTTVGDEGGYAPALSSNEEPLQLIMEAVEKAGYKAGEEIAIALDPACSEVFEDGKYHLKKDAKVLGSDEMIELFKDWVDKYPIVSIEDGFAEDDWDGFQNQMEVMGDKIQIVGDDFFVTNVKRLKVGIEKKAANSILIKVNQIGSISETLDTIQMAKDAGMTSVVSHRSGETEDMFIADFVVGLGTGQIKTGSLSRSERVGKYNQLMRIANELGDKAKIAEFPFKR